MLNATLWAAEWINPGDVIVIAQGGKLSSNRYTKSAWRFLVKWSLMRNPRRENRWVWLATTIGRIPSYFRRI